MSGRKRRNITIESHGETLAGWLYPAQRDEYYERLKAGPGIVLAHGLGATKEMRLDAYAERFSTAGYTTLVFEYRCIGQSTGKPRGLVDVKMQYEDWIQAIKYIRSQAAVDRHQVAIFSITFGSLNAIKIAAQDTALKAIICQCPLLKSVKSRRATPIFDMPTLLYFGIKDCIFGTDDKPITVPIHSIPGHVSLTKAPESQEGYLSLLPAKLPHHPNAIPARFVLRAPWLRPGKELPRVKTPIFFSICALDTIAPPKVALKYGLRAPNASFVWFDHYRHYDLYHGEGFEMAIKYYLEFLAKHLSLEDNY